MSGFAITDKQQNKSDTWLTPLPLIHSLGEFDLDPCAYPGHHTAKTMWYENGDMNEWFGRVWLNPPYSDVARWLDMLAEHGRGVALVFARTDTRWAQRHFKKATAITFINKRIKFLNHEFKEYGTAGHGSMLLYYGEAAATNIEGFTP